MPGPKAAAIELSESDRTTLEKLVRRPSTAQQIALRGRIILEAAAGQNNAQISRTLELDVDTVRLWRQRWLLLDGIARSDLSVAERLVDAPRSGRPSELTAEQICQIVALACEAPEQAGRPITHWTGREIADELQARGIVEQISPRHAQRLLKKTMCSRT